MSHNKTNSITIDVTELATNDKPILPKLDMSPISKKDVIFNMENSISNNLSTVRKKGEIEPELILGSTTDRDVKNAISSLIIERENSILNNDTDKTTTPVLIDNGEKISNTEHSNILIDRASTFENHILGPHMGLDSIDEKILYSGRVRPRADTLKNNLNHDDQKISSRSDDILKRTHRRMLSDENDDNNMFDSHTNRISKKLDTMDLFKLHKKIENRETNSVVEAPQEIVNGWDELSKRQLRIWYETFKSESFKYKFIYDRNIEMSNKLNLSSIILASILGIFSGFKLWINDDVFQLVSNLLLVFSNFGLAYIINLSKTYVDSQTNDQIRLHVDEIEFFLSKLSQQILKSKNYRMNADKFFQIIEDKYNDVISSGPMLSIEDIKTSVKAYKEYKIFMDEYVNENKIYNKI